MSTAPQQTISQLLHDVAIGSAYDDPEKAARARFEIEQRFAALEQDAKNWQDWREDAKKGGLRIDSYWREWFDKMRADATRWRTSGPLDELFKFVQANAATSGPLSGQLGETYAAILLRCLPSLLADANRFALLRMVSLEPNEALRDLMLDAMDRIVAANDAENKPLTVENFNDTFDTAIVECNRIRSEHANPT
jgi:hypothetical protein